MPAQKRSAPHAPESVTSDLNPRLPVLLSLIAGLVDVIGFLGLGHVFTAHITGNLVVMAADLVGGRQLNPAQALAIPVFGAAVAVTGLLGRVWSRNSALLSKRLLRLQFVLLAADFAVCVTARPSLDPLGPAALGAALIAVSAMGCQFALLRISLPGAPSTAVMTGNITRIVLSLVAHSRDSGPHPRPGDTRLRESLPPLLAFLTGCAVGAAAFGAVGDVAWVLPAALAGLTAV
jgi:uncharacterized membrane protein YoaK (UPF0700 family)